MILRCVLLLAGALCWTGCVVETAGPPHHDFQTIERDRSEQVRVSLNMGAGNLRISPGTEKLMRADFTYSVPSWKPEVKYDSVGGHGNLTIRQPESHTARIGHNAYEWDLRLNRDVPLDLSMNFGAGEANLDLGALTLRRVSVEMGVGSLKMDLRGNPKQDYDVRIQGGVGEATVRLPSDVGVDADAEGGIGEIKVQGMHRDGRRYYNGAYADAKVKIHVSVQGGIGSIHLISD
jgi:hypothetical protein